MVEHTSSDPVFTGISDDLLLSRDAQILKTLRRDQSVVTGTAHVLSIAGWAREQLPSSAPGLNIFM